MSLDKLLVLTDFTEASDRAAAHAYQLAKINQAEIVALHAIQHDEDLEWAKSKTESQFKALSEYNAKISLMPLASKLHLFKELNRHMRQHGIDLMFMPTHGKKDLQFITGSDALKVIFNADHPTIVVQRKTPLKAYRHIAMPILKEYADAKHQLSSLIQVAQLFHSRVDLLLPAVNDKSEEALIRHAGGHINRLLESHGVASELRMVDDPSGKWTQLPGNVLSSSSTDLIALSAGLGQSNKSPIVSKSYVQSMITNKELIPVLIF